jgi:hypothetical protein
MDRLQERQWRSRTKRCLKESSEFSVRKEKGVSYYRRRDFLLERVKGIIERYRQLVQNDPMSLVKNASNVGVAILTDGRQDLCIKQFRYPGVWERVKDSYRRSKGMKGWIGGNGLRSRGIPSVMPLALAEEKGLFRGKESFLIMETPETGQELDRHIVQGFSGLEEKRSFIKTFARWLSHFHQMNLYHQDMKTCNIFIRSKGDGWDFLLLDLEDVRLTRKPDEKGLFRNFLQLNTSTPRVITRSDRFRFFKEYVREHSIIRDEKNFLRRLVAESRRRGLVYVSPRGVVIEKM